MWKIDITISLTRSIFGFEAFFDAETSCNCASGAPSLLLPALLTNIGKVMVLMAFGNDILVRLVLAFGNDDGGVLADGQ